MNDGIHCIAEVDSSGTLLKSYTWNPRSIDLLLAFTDYTGGETNTYYALTDHIGTVHAVTDGSGSIVESYRFDAWGRVLGVYDSNGQPLSESAIGNRYLWQGREYSWATGLYFFRSRWYDPITGRFLSKDPGGIAFGLNQYIFPRNNPVNFRDPFGLDAFSLIVRALGKLAELWDSLRGADPSNDPAWTEIGELNQEIENLKKVTPEGVRVKKRIRIDGYIDSHLPEIRNPLPPPYSYHDVEVVGEKKVPSVPTPEPPSPFPDSPKDEYDKNK